MQGGTVGEGVPAYPRGSTLHFLNDAHHQPRGGGALILLIASGWLVRRPIGSTSYSSCRNDAGGVVLVAGPFNYATTPILDNGLKAHVPTSGCRLPIRMRTSPWPVLNQAGDAAGAGAFQRVPSRSIAQQITSKRRAVATIPILARPLLPRWYRWQSALSHGLCI